MLHTTNARIEESTNREATAMTLARDTELLLGYWLERILAEKVLASRHTPKQHSSFIVLLKDPNRL